MKKYLLKNIINIQLEGEDTTSWHPKTQIGFEAEVSLMGSQRHPWLSGSLFIVLITPFMETFLTPAHSSDVF